MSSINVLTANARKVFIEMLRYLPNTISSIVTFYAIFLLLFLGINVVGGSDATAHSTQYMIVSLVLWILALAGMQGIGWEITQEATRGTLEQLYMSPISAWRILLARMISSVAASLVIIGVMLLLAMVTSGQWLRFDLATLGPLMLLTLTCMIGVGFALAGLAIVVKQIQAFLQVAQFIVLVLVAVPVTFSPWLEALPVVRGATMIREAMTTGTTLFEFVPTEWLLLAVNSTVYFAAGVLVYQQSERYAMARGLLGQY
jgi:ABC-2 type transport system permease protein